MEIAMGTDDKPESNYPLDLLARANRVFQNQPISAYSGRVRAIIGPKSKQYEGLAAEAMQALSQNGKPTPKQLAALEFVIRLMRPAPLSRLGRFEALDAELAPSFPDWDRFTQSIAPYICPIGRIDRTP